MVVLRQIQSILYSGSFFSTLILIVSFFSIAWVIHRLAVHITRFILGFNHFASERRRWRTERLDTLRGLIASSITFLAFTLASLLTLSLFVSVDTLIWTIGLFSAAFGLGARPLISDYLTGIGFIFEDTLDVGEKVELVGIVGIVGAPIEGVVEAINLRVTLLRSTTGETYTIPNGEIRIIRNFSRGRFSTCKVKVKVTGSKIEDALVILEDLGEDAISLLPALLEPWEVVSPDGEVGPQTQLVIVAKSRFGQAAKMRPRLLSLVQKRLEESGIELIS